MKKVIIAAVVLAVLSAVSVAIFLSFKSKSEKETKKQADSLADNVLFDVPEDSINKMQIEYSDRSYTVEYSEDEGKWILADSSNGDSFSLNQTTLSKICTFIGNLTATTNYGEADEENKSRYGLDNPYRITFTDSEETHTLYIGDKSPTGDYYYAYTDTKENIYAIDSSDAESIITDRFKLVDNKLIPYGDNEINGITVKRKGKPVYELTYKNGLWELPEEYSMLTVNQTRPSNIVTMVTRLTAEEIFEYSDETFRQYGFDDPDAEFTIKSTDGTEKTILVNSYGKNAQTYLYVYLTDSKQIETYYTSDLKFINYDIYDLIMQTVECANMYAVSEFEISCSELSEKFTVDATNGAAECRGCEIDLTNAEIKSFFQTFYNSFAYIGIVDIDVDSEPELEDPVFSAKYTFPDGRVSEIDFVRTGEGNRCFVFADGEYTGTISDCGFISGTNSMLSTYEVLCSHAGIEPEN